VYKRIISKGDPVERFVGKTCILGLGYGTGAEKLRHTLKTQPPGADLPLDECKSIVSLYRSTNTDITELWRECDLALEAMMGGVSRPFTLGKHGCVVVNKDGIRLPNGLYIRYNKLRLDENGKKIYTSRRGDVGVWGGAVVENVVQALARIIVGEQMVQLANIGLRPVLTVHDAAVCVVPEKDAADAVEVLKAVMSTPPDWCASLPVACEAKFGQSYGAC
jgi:DNA polymerase